VEWEIIDSGRQSAQFIMDRDKELLANLTSFSKPILHLYEWEGECLTYGYFTQPADYLNVEEAARLGIAMARRPTGGGIIFHLTDLAFSVLIPSESPHFSLNTMDNYRFVNSLAALAVASLLGSLNIELLGKPVGCKPSFCMAYPTQFDIMVNGKKMGGAAQRRTKRGFLHQGSLSLAAPPEAILRACVKEEIYYLMQQNSYSLLQDTWTQKDLVILRSQLVQNLIEVVKA
jgi:lipoate-protein ligase A